MGDIGGIPTLPAILGGLKIGTDVWSDISDMRAKGRENRKQEALADYVLKYNAMNAPRKKPDPAKQGLAMSGVDLLVDSQPRPSWESYQQKIALESGPDVALEFRDKTRGMQFRRDLMDGYAKASTAEDMVAKLPDLMRRYPDLKEDEFDPTVKEFLPLITAEADKKKALAQVKSRLGLLRRIASGEDPLAVMQEAQSAEGLSSLAEFSKGQTKVKSRDTDGGTLITEEDRFGSEGFSHFSRTPAGGKGGGAGESKNDIVKQWNSTIDSRVSAVRTTVDKMGKNSAAILELINSGRSEEALHMLVGGAGSALSKEAAEDMLEYLTLLESVRQEGIDMAARGGNPNLYLKVPNIYKAAQEKKAKGVFTRTINKALGSFEKE